MTHTDNAEKILDHLRRSRETIMDFSPDQMRLFNGLFDLIADLQKRVTRLERPRPDTKANLLDPNGFIEAVIRRAADDGRADEIIERLRGGH